MSGSGSRRTPSLDRSQRAEAAAFQRRRFGNTSRQDSRAAEEYRGRLNNAIQFITVSIISRAGRLIFHLQPGQFTGVHILATGPFFFFFCSHHVTGLEHIIYPPAHSAPASPPCSHLAELMSHKKKKPNFHFAFMSTIRRRPDRDSREADAAGGRAVAPRLTPCQRTDTWWRHVGAPA